MKKSFLLVVLLTFCMLLTGCSSSSSEDPNASLYSDYVSGLLKLIYLSDASDYSAMTGVSESSAASVYTNNVQEIVDEVAKLCGFTSLTADERQEILEVVEDQYSRVDYKVEEAVYDQTAGNYTVVVKLTPVNLKSCLQGEIDAYVDEMNERMLNRELDDLSEEAYDQLYREEVMKDISEITGQTQKTDTVSIRLVFCTDSNGSAYISEEDISTLSRTALGF